MGFSQKLPHHLLRRKHCELPLFEHPVYLNVWLRLRDLTVLEAKRIETGVTFTVSLPKEVSD